jgi:hypothetical protein
MQIYYIPAAGYYIILIKHFLVYGLHFQTISIVERNSGRLGYGNIIWLQLTVIIYTLAIMSFIAGALKLR